MKWKRKTRISFAICSLIRTFGFAEGTFIRKSENKLLFLSLFTHLFVPLHHISS